MFDAREMASKGAEEYAPLPFIGMDGEQYELPHPLTLTSGQQLRLMEAQKAGDEPAMFELFSQLSPAAVEAIKDMPAHVTGKLFDEWYKAFGDAGDSGNSQQPSSPPNRAARRSKRTSQSAASR